MSSTKLLYIISSAPYSNSAGQEALDAALIGAAFEQEVSLLFIHDGVFQLKAGQDVSESELKPFTKAYVALADFGIERVFSHDLSLAARGLDSEALMRPVSIIDSDGVRELIQSHDRVFSF